MMLRCVQLVRSRRIAWMRRHASAPCCNVLHACVCLESQVRDGKKVDFKLDCIRIGAYNDIGVAGRFCLRPWAASSQ